MTSGVLFFRLARGLSPAPSSSMCWIIIRGRGTHERPDDRPKRRHSRRNVDCARLRPGLALLPCVGAAYAAACSSLLLHGSWLAADAKGLLRRLRSVAENL